jgi:hypothetical protein
MSMLPDAQCQLTAAPSQRLGTGDLPTDRSRSLAGGHK